MKTTTITNEQSPRFWIPQGVYFSPATAEGCIVLNIERGTILSLNDTGALMFARIGESKHGLTRDELVQLVSKEFADVEASRVEAAVDALLTRLEKTGALGSECASRNNFGLRVALAEKVSISVSHILAPFLLLKAYTCAALILLLTIDGVQKLGGFRSFHRAVEQWTLRMRAPSDSVTIANACAAVNRACLWHPKRALCLQRASTLVCLLRSLGVNAQMVIGVHTMPFYGHAWAEVEGQVVNDHVNAQRFFHVLTRC